MNRLDPSCPTAWSAAIIWFWKIQFFLFYFPLGTTKCPFLKKKFPFLLFFERRLTRTQAGDQSTLRVFFSLNQTTGWKRRKMKIFFHRRALKRVEKKKKQKKKRNFLDSLTETQGQLFNSSHETWTNTLAHTQHHNQQVT